MVLLLMKLTHLCFQVEEQARYTAAALETLGAHQQTLPSTDQTGRVQPLSRTGSATLDVGRPQRTGAGSIALLSKTGMLSRRQSLDTENPDQEALCRLSSSHDSRRTSRTSAEFEENALFANLVHGEGPLKRTRKLLKQQVKTDAMPLVGRTLASVAEDDREGRGGWLLLKWLCWLDLARLCVNLCHSRTPHARWW